MENKKDIASFKEILSNTVFAPKLLGSGYLGNINLVDGFE